MEKKFDRKIQMEAMKVFDEQIAQKYRDESVNMPESTIRYKIGNALELCRAIVNNGGTEKEIALGTLYIGVCINAEKNQLNVKKFEEDYQIKELEKKYLGKETPEMKKVVES